MKAGIESGVITAQRLDDALRRILGLKAKLGLYRKENVTAAPELKDQMVGCEEHLRLAEEAAEHCITLVKDTRGDLPIDPKLKKRARLVFIQSTPTSKAYKKDPVKQIVIEELERAGFTVDVAPNFHDLEVSEGVKPQNMITMMNCGSMKEFAAKYDVCFGAEHQGLCPGE